MVERRSPKPDVEGSSPSGRDLNKRGILMANQTKDNVDMKEMARQAVKILRDKIRGKEKYCGTRYVDSRIIERQSVKDLRIWK